MFRNQNRNQEVVSIERLRVQRVLIALAGGGDRGDSAKVRALLAAEVELDLEGWPTPARISAEEVARLSEGNAAILGFTAEAISLPEIEVTGARARAVSFGHTFHARPFGPAARNLWLLHCRYEHELKLEDGGWKVSAVRMRSAPRPGGPTPRRKRNRAVAAALAPSG